MMLDSKNIMEKKLVDIKNLHTYFYGEPEPVKAVQNVSFEIWERKIICLVGASGSGKTVTGLSLIRLVPTPAGRIVSGEIWYQGKDLTKLTDQEIRCIRGKEISMIFQEPLTSLNPVIPVGEQITEVIKLHQRLPQWEAKREASKVMEMVQLPNVHQTYKAYPHELSGGMRQRIMIAMAISCRPKLLIADEPTTALDVTVQAQILDLLKEMKDTLGMSILFITHDMGVVAEMADHVVVMQEGRIVEQGSVGIIFAHPAHPYTQKLLQSSKRGRGR